MFISADIKVSWPVKSVVRCGPRATTRKSAVIIPRWRVSKRPGSERCVASWSPPSASSLARSSAPNTSITLPAVSAVAHPASMPYCHVRVNAPMDQATTKLCGRP